MYAARTTPYQGSLMVDICDLDLVGHKLEQNGLVINLTKEYYQQQVIAASEARELLTKISGVPFLMIFKFQNS